MPIYEFYCSACHAVLSFLSRSVNTGKRPDCPRCGKKYLDREISAFAMTGRARESDDMADLPINECQMESAIGRLAGEAEGMSEEDPRQAAKLMRKFSDMTGIQYGKGMEEALSRLETGEDPEKIEAEMGRLLESEEEPILLPGRKGGKSGTRRGAALFRDPKLYEM